MINIATEELCKELYQASDRTWKDTYMRRYYDDGMFPTHEKLNGLWLPAYDLGYLLRKLPPVIQDPYDRVFKHLQLWINGDTTVHAGYVEPYAHDDKVAYVQESTTPEDAACKLAIELFKQGILNPTEQENK